MKDILAHPAELTRILARTTGSAALRSAVEVFNASDHIYITGIGSSWHAGMAVQSIFDSAGRPCRLVDASELLSFVRLPANTAILVLSRSGRSYEIVRLVAKAKQAHAKIIGITNSPDSPLARCADAALLLGARFDHLVSVTMYSGVALAGALLASAAVGALDDSLTECLRQALSASGSAMEVWSRRIEDSSWLAQDGPTYFLARAGSLASCHEARLLWEEAAKSPATAMSTGGFRHGSQEVIQDGMRIGLWLDADTLREEDLALARDARRSGAKLLVIGQDLPPNSGDLVVDLPAIPGSWQFLVDIIPAQIAAEHLARLRKVDCDSFRLCPYVIETGSGL